MNCDHKPKLGQSDLVYWVYVYLAYIAVLTVECRKPWAACLNMAIAFQKQQLVQHGCVQLHH